MLANTKKICKSCGTEIESGAKFCNYCGNSQNAEHAEIIETKVSLGSLVIFFCILSVLSLIGNFSDIEIEGLLLLDVIFAAITITWVVFSWKDIRPFLKWHKFNPIKALIYSSLSVGFAIIVSYIVTWLNKSMFGVEGYYYLAFEHLHNAKLITILVIALQPAVFEELAFRGVIQQGLTGFLKTSEVVFLTSFLFAILHMSFISLFWLIPFAIWLSNIRNKENTIWYGVLMHFCFNTAVCFIEFFKLDII